jgi:hypothetical protein
MGGVNLCLRKAASVEPTPPPNDDVKLRSRVWARQVIAERQTDLKVSNHRAGPGFAIT